MNDIQKINLKMKNYTIDIQTLIKYLSINYTIDLIIILG